MSMVLLDWLEGCKIEFWTTPLLTSWNRYTDTNSNIINVSVEINTYTTTTTWSRLQIMKTKLWSPPSHPILVESMICIISLLLLCLVACFPLTLTCPSLLVMTSSPHDSGRLAWSHNSTFTVFARVEGWARCRCQVPGVWRHFDVV